MKTVGQERCALCRRSTKRGTTEHHLVPRTLHSNKWFRKRFTRDQMRQTISVCHDCHRAIHDFVPRHKDLGREFNTLEKLLRHQRLAIYVAWVRQRR